MRREGWGSCRCGKEYPIRYPRDECGDKEWEMYQKLHQVSLCHACSMEAHKAHDMCPEGLRIPGGSSGCRLTWHHDGRCEPFPPVPPDVLAEARAQAALPKPPEGL